MKRFVIHLAAVICLLALSFSAFPAAKADSLYTKKIVSLVLDDSGTMTISSSGSDYPMRWDFAVYALETMAAMLNPEDELYVTLLSDWDHSITYDLSDENIGDTVERIRNMPFNQGSTPFNSVVTGFDLLRQKQAPDNTEYYLVVITDGVFDSDMYAKTHYHNPQEAFDQFLSERMPNGSRPKIIFMGIGSSVSTVTPDESRGLYVYNADEQEGIVRVLDQISDRISVPTGTTLYSLFFAYSFSSLRPGNVFMRHPPP